MWLRKAKAWQLPEREAAAESVYLSRRKLLGTAAALAAGGVACRGGGILVSCGGLGGGDANESAGGAAQGPPLHPLSAARNPKYKVEGRGISPESVTAGYNNYYEFFTDKRRVAEWAARFTSRPWQIEVRGQVAKPMKFDVDDLLKRFPLEERVYRLRCVEAWSIVVPWIGFSMVKFIEWCQPTAKAKYLRMVGVLRPGECPGQREQTWYPWPYFEGLRMDEAANELAFLVVGSYGHVLPNQNGSPLRLAVPWKYGYKSIKAITQFEFTERQPPTFWNQLAPSEYDFLSNVNPAKPHPRWSQATEEDVATGKRIPTLPYNGYAEYVAHLYK